MSGSVVETYEEGACACGATRAVRRWAKDIGVGSRMVWRIGSPLASCSALAFSTRAGRGHILATYPQD
jgi:hypothetical protein